MAIKVLTGAGGNKGFLKTIQQAQLMSVVNEVRKSLKKLPQTLADKDVEVMKIFLTTPESFTGHPASFAQVGQKGPNGDYTPQSSQIQSILKGTKTPAAEPWPFTSKCMNSEGACATCDKSRWDLEVPPRIDFKECDMSSWNHSLAMTLG